MFWLAINSTAVFSRGYWMNQSFFPPFQPVSPITGRERRGPLPGGRGPAGHSQRPALPPGHHGGPWGADVPQLPRPAGLRAPEDAQGHVRDAHCYIPHAPLRLLESVDDCFHVIFFVFALEMVHSVSDWLFCPLLPYRPSFSYKVTSTVASVWDSVKWVFSR